jgi:ribosomal protein S18 acetylase RimI-like enzyme
MIIKQVKRVSKEIKDFEKKGWYKADIEHYGKSRPYSKEKYKFVSKDAGGNVTGVLDFIIEANVGYIENLLVGEEYRGSGVGKSLVLFVEEFAKEEGCTKIWLDTEEGWGAVDFYKRMGYKITGTHEEHHLGNRAFIFTKFL